MLTVAILLGLIAKIAVDEYRHQHSQHWQAGISQQVRQLQGHVRATNVLLASGEAPQQGDVGDVEPVRRRRHLALFRGGLVAVPAALVGVILKRLRRIRPQSAIATAAAVAVATTVAVAAYAASNKTPPRPHSQQPRPSSTAATPIQPTAAPKPPAREAPHVTRRTRPHAAAPPKAPSRPPTPPAPPERQPPTTSPSPTPPPCRIRILSICVLP